MTTVSISISTEEARYLRKFIRQHNITKPNGGYVSITQLLNSRIRRAIDQEVKPNVKV